MRPAQLAAVLSLVLTLVCAPALAASSLEELCPPGERCRDYDELARLVDEEILPLPDGNPGPLVMPPGGWSQWGRPQPRTPVWNPAGTKRVGLQAGHYEYYDAPRELLSLRRNPGAPGGGRIEWEVTIELARLAAGMLEERGYEVDVLPVYRTVTATPDPAVIERVRRGDVDALTFTSSSTVTNLFDLLGDVLAPQPLVASIGPVTSKTAIERGLRVDVEASEHTIGGLVDALLRALASPGRG